ncbi:MAG: double-strand break repair helicase AddA [Alphaproteobacteria bacterium]|nr:double-strand break repair helicase AddA [Alphaproteobacteria bacterium]
MSAPPSTPELEEATRGQALAATPDANAWVAANAGSGKTKVLIDRVARLLLAGAAPDSILCVTYTKAAASEMQARLFEVLGGWCVMETGKLREELEKLEGSPREDVGQARELFARALETPGGLRIETIHAFCGRVLRRFPLEAGIAPGFQELDDQASDELWDDAFRALGAHLVRGAPELTDAARVVAEAGGSGFGVLRDLHDKRAEVLAFIETAGGIEPAIAVLRREIGAGEHTVEHLLEQAMGADLPRDALARAAAAYRSGGKTDNVQADCIDYALGDAPAADRFDVYCGVVLTKAGDPRKSTATAGVRAAHPVVVDLFSTDLPEGSETLRIRAVLGAIAARRIFERSSALLRLAESVFRDFARRKDARAGLDFDDLIHGVGRLLTRADAAEWVLWKLDGGVEHILLDEAQDTSPHQWTILRKLTEDIFAGAGAVRERARTLFVVGDQKQSIYSFQGADPEHFLQQYQEMRGLADAAQVALNAPTMAMSFRSVGQVLDYVDEVFNADHFAGESPFSLLPPEEANYAAHKPFRLAQHGSVELWPLKPHDKAGDPDPWDAPVDQVLETSPRVQLARDVAAHIRREIDRGATVWEKNGERAVRPGDFLILVKRRTGGLFDALLQALKLQRLPVAGADRIQLLDSLAVQDLLNLVRFALCPEDDLTLAEILKGPFGGLDDDQLLELAWDRGSQSLWSRLYEVKSAEAKPVRDFLADLLQHRREAPFEFLTRALERPAGLPDPGWERILARFGDPAREPVTALLDRAAAFDARGAPSLQLFLDGIERHGGEVKRELSGPQDEVRVMTVHGAKGLQAPVVILPDTTSAPKLDKGGLYVTPTGAPVWVGKKNFDTRETALMRLDADARALREHRRLLYVALTRAQDRLVVCGAWHGSGGGAGADKASWYALASQAMERLADAGVAEQTDAGYRIGPMTKLASERDTTSAVQAPALPAWLRRDAPPEPPATRIVSPSSLGGDEPPANPPFGPGRAARLRRGTLIHRLLEGLPEIAPRSRRKAGRDFLSRQPDLALDERKEMLEAAMGMLEDEQFSMLFAPGGRAEAPVIGPLGDRIVNGRVDRLVVTDSEILIADYKTDRPAPATPSNVGEAYLAQMAAYRRILLGRWPEKAVRCFLAYTDGPKLMEIPGEDLDRALQRVLG